MDTLPNSKIWGITAREILDSRSNPTIETTVILESGYKGTASIPSGASIGKYEALELRDNDMKRYNGMGVLSAVKNVNETIQHALKGMDAINQRDIDEKMIALDGTAHKGNLGANAILSVSIASAVAVAASYRIPVYQYIHSLFSKIFPSSLTKIPTPIFNMINGGKHGAGNLNFQEFQVIPATNKSFSTALEIGSTLYHIIKKILISRNAIHSVGDEGGFAPDLFSNMDALEILYEGIHESPYQFGVDVFLGLDMAASEFLSERGYEIRDSQQPLTATGLLSYITELHKKYHLLLLEDALDEDDWGNWHDLTKTLGKEVLIIGDDLLATNEKRLEQAIKDEACSAILLKPNQIGTLSEFFDVVACAKKNDIKCVVSHRSGETTDTFIADLAVGIDADYVKFGAPARGERIIKYNRLLQIEQELFFKAS